MNDVHYSSQSNEWETPEDMFAELDREFKFTLDPAATPVNAKCTWFYTKETDGLAQSWDGETVFCNPPYGREIGKWVKKAAESKALTVMLIPARTDTSYFHDYIYGKAEIRFLRGRVKFVNSEFREFKASSSPAPFPSMIVVFRNL